MLLIWHPGQEKVSQEFAVSRGLENGSLKEPSTCCCSSVSRPSGHGKIVEPSWSSAALANSLDRQYILPAQLRLLLSAFPHFTATESHNQTNATRRTAWKKIAFAERQRARNFLIFRCGCKHETLGCKRLKVKWRINFATRLIFLGPSQANLDFLFSNFAVRDFILFTLDFNT